MGRLTKDTEKTQGRLGAPKAVQQAPAKTEPGFFKQFAGGIVKPFQSFAVTGAGAVVGTAGLATAGAQALVGKKDAAKKTLATTQEFLDEAKNTGVRVPFTGERATAYYPDVQKPSEVITKGLPTILQGGGEVGSYVVGGGSLAGLKTALAVGGKEALKAGGRLVAKNALVDFLAGGTAGVAAETQNKDATPMSTLKAGLTSGAISAVATPLLGAGLRGGITATRGLLGMTGKGLDRVATGLEKKVAAQAEKPVVKSRIFEGVDKPPVPLATKAADVTAKGIRAVQNIPKVFNRHVLDRYSPIAEFQTKAKEAGINVPDLQDMAQSTGYKASGMAQNRLDDYTSLIQKYGNDWQYVKESSRYLDALDRLSRGDAIEGGYTVQEVKDSLAKLGQQFTPEERLRISQGAKDLQTFLNTELEDAVASGRLSRESFNQIKQAHPNYIPHDVLDFLDVEGPQIAQGTGKSLQLTKSGIEKAKGSTRAIDDVDNAVVRRMFRQQMLNEKNKTMAAIIGTGKEMGEKSGFVPFTDGMKAVDIPKDLEKVSYFNNGIKEEWLVPKDMGLAIKNMGGDDANIVMQWLNNSLPGKVMTAPATALRAVATGLNPVFGALSNPIRDIQTSQFTAKASLNDFSFGLLKSISANLRGITDDELYRLAREAGALQGTLLHEATENPAKLIAKKLSTGNIISKTLRSNWNPIELTQNVAKTMEEMTRLAVFKRSLMEGLKPEQAAKMARNSTVDFGKSGYTIQVLNKVIPFLNARIQGFSNLGKAIVNNPEKAVRVGMITAAYPTAVLTAVNSNYESYQNIPDNEKRKFWIIMIGETDGEDLDKNPIKIPHYIKIPKGEAQQAISNVLERALTLSQQKYPDSTKQFLAKISGDISPVTESSLLPAGLQQAIELKTNYSLYRDAPIESPYTKIDKKWYETKELEPRFRYKYNTSEVAKRLGSALNWSPTKIDYIIKTGVINEMVRTGDLMSKGFMSEGEKFDKAAELPGVRTFLGNSSYGKYLKEKELENKETQKKNTEQILNKAQPVINTGTGRLSK